MSDAQTLELEHTGLTSTEAKQRLEAGQGNRQPDDLTRSIWQILRANVFTLFNAIVFAGFGVLLGLGRWQDALFGLPAIFNTAIGVVQESRATKTLAKLKVLNAPTVRVVRDLQTVSLPPEEVVLGDLLFLKGGDQLVADARVVSLSTAGGLDVDESLLTGESDPQIKNVGSELMSGSSVVSGSGYATVVRVGAESYAAQLTAKARKFVLVRSELRGSIDKLLKWITWLLAPVALIVAYGQIMAVGGFEVAFSQGHWREAIVGAIAAIIAMVPLGLVLVTSIAFAVSGVALARNGVLVQELAAVEGLARVDALCLDKTGTITTGKMALHDVEVLNETPGLPSILGWLATSDVATGTTQTLAERFGEVALKDGIKRAIPFDSARKWSGLTVKQAALRGEHPTAPGTWAMGAPEFVSAGLEADPEFARALARVTELANEGLRAMLVVHSEQLISFERRDSAAVVGGADSAVADTDAAVKVRLPAGLKPVAIVTLTEVVRPDAAQTMAYFADQKVDVRIISGDNPRTVAAIARTIGVEAGEGFDARYLPHDPVELATVLERERVFGRVTPEQKLAMVKSLQGSGHVVGMTGDGVNDVLAIKEADLGIAMDTAAPATQAVARIVLLDGKFDSLPKVVLEGRRVTANIERVSMLFLSKTSYAMLVGIVFGITAWGFPFLPRHLSITDGITIGIPAFFLALMLNKKRYRAGFLARSLKFAIPAGAIVMLSLVALKLLADLMGSFTSVQMWSASTLTLAGVGLWILAVLARPFHWFRLLIVLAMYVGLWLIWAIPLSRQFFEIDWLPSNLALLVLGVVLVGMVLIEVLRAWHIRVTEHDDQPAAGHAGSHVADANVISISKS